MTLQIESTTPGLGAPPVPLALPLPAPSLTMPATAQAPAPSGDGWLPASTLQKASVAKVSIDPEVTPPPKLLKPFGIEMWAGPTAKTGDAAV